MSANAHLRPIIVVLDDYNNYIDYDKGEHQFRPVFRKEEAVDAVLAKRYIRPQSVDGKVDGKKDLLDSLTARCLVLNELAKSFAVDAPPIWLPEPEEPEEPEEPKDPSIPFSQVFAAIPFDRFDRLRDKIGAFIVGLEWLPTGERWASSGERWASSDSVANGSLLKGKKVGMQAIRLLKARYPEVLVFLYTGQWEDALWEESLAHGASWGFWNPKTHHENARVGHKEQLEVEKLQKRMENAMTIRYGTYLDPPDSSVLDMKGPIARQLAKRLGFTLPIQQEGRGFELQCILASLFPNATTITPDRVPQSGFSGAGTFIVTVDQPGGRVARRFIKVDGWSSIVREWMGCRKVIEPRFGSNAATPVSGPVLIKGDESREPKGALAYNLAGLPEEGVLKSLGDLLRRARTPDDFKRIRARVSETLYGVLKPLYRSCHTETRPFWNWFGAILGPLFTGRIAEGAEGDEEGGNRKWCARGPEHGRKYASAEWLAAARSADKFVGAKPPSEPPVVHLYGFIFEGLSAGRDTAVGRLVLRDPCLGFRIQLRGDVEKLRAQFGTAWARPGMRTSVRAILDKDNREYELHEVLFSEFKASYPFKWFSRETGVPLNFCIPMREGPVHGDFNMENMIFSGDDGPAWLIDFAHAKERGMVVSDTSQLEVAIWNHHIIPLLDACSQRDELLEKLLGAVDGARPHDFEKRLGDMIADHHSEIDSVRVLGLAALVCDLQEFGRDGDLGIGADEVYWARAAHAFSALRYPDTSNKHLTCKMSEWNLKKVTSGCGSEGK